MDTALAAPRAESPARTALLNAALNAFAAYGFEGAGTRAIAQAAGTNQGLVRHHFGSKEGLWRELIERGLDPLLQALEQAGPSAWLAAPGDGANPQRALLQLIVHALLEPGPRRDWLVRSQLEPLRRRALARGLLPATASPNDALLLSWLGAHLAPVLCAPALHAATGRTLSIAAPGRAAGRVAGPWSLAAPNGRATPAPAAGSTPAAAS
jgi:AcrR family transcriptional regulator